MDYGSRYLYCWCNYKHNFHIKENTCTQTPTSFLIRAIKYLVCICSNEDYAKDARECAFEEVFFGVEEEDVCAPAAPEGHIAPGDGVYRITNIDECDEVCEAQTCFAFVNQLKKLAVANVHKCTQHGCQLLPVVKESFVGSALYLTWVRQDFLNDGHNYAWQMTWSEESVEEKNKSTQK